MSKKKHFRIVVSWLRKPTFGCHYKWSIYHDINGSRGNSVDVGYGGVSENLMLIEAHARHYLTKDNKGRPFNLTIDYYGDSWYKERDTTPFRPRLP